MLGESFLILFFWGAMICWLVHQGPWRLTRARSLDQKMRMLTELTNFQLCKLLFTHSMVQSHRFDVLWCIIEDFQSGGRWSFEQFLLGTSSSSLFPFLILSGSLLLDLVVYWICNCLEDCNLYVCASISNTYYHSNMPAYYFVCYFFT